MPNQVSNSVRLILKPFLFDYNDRLKLKKRPSGGLPDGRFGEE